MELSIETQLIRVLDRISQAEKTKNRALVRQTSRLFKAIFSLKEAARPKNGRNGNL